MIVVKVGGSLYDHPGLGPGLRAFLDTLAPARVRIVPGGGPFADAVRAVDATHHLGEDAAHWLALGTLGVAGRFLDVLLRAAGPPDPHPPADRVTVCDCLAFAVADEDRADHLPHSWAITSDSVAARVAVVEGASRLILLKSVDIPPGTTWDEAAERGWVDRSFPALVARHHLPVEVIHFRRRLDQQRSPAP